MNLKARMKRLETLQAAQQEHGLHIIEQCEPDCLPNCRHKARMCRDPHCPTPLLTLDIGHRAATGEMPYSTQSGHSNTRFAS